MQIFRNDFGAESIERTFCKLLRNRPAPSVTPFTGTPLHASRSTWRAIHADLLWRCTRWFTRGCGELRQPRHFWLSLHSELPAKHGGGIGDPKLPVRVTRCPSDALAPAWALRFSWFCIGTICRTALPGAARTHASGALVHGCPRGAARSLLYQTVRIPWMQQGAIASLRMAL